MINFEKYKDKIKELYRNGNVGLYKGKLVSCDDLSCNECDLSGANESCLFKLLEWCLQEYIEPPKLTEREHAFCVAAKSGYIARDENGNLCYFTGKPYKVHEHYAWDVSEDSDAYVELEPFNFDFSFIKWTDEEPWSVKDLLKLEV